MLVPVDVRAIDRDGDPVIDLRQSDFTIEENGVDPDHRAFLDAGLHTAGYRRPTPSAPPLRRGPGLESTPITHRTFAIVLGRGRLQGPSKGLDAIIEFVRTDLLPQDRVAVLAYGRATDLTTDRDAHRTTARALSGATHLISRRFSTSISIPVAWRGFIGRIIRRT